MVRAQVAAVDMVRCAFYAGPVTVPPLLVQAWVCKPG
jgi:hypothetical protein